MRKRPINITGIDLEDLHTLSKVTDRLQNILSHEVSALKPTTNTQT